MNRHFARFARIAHKWMGLILGLQVLFWIAGGVVMSAIPLERVHGKHLATKTLPNPFSQSDYAYNVDKVIQRLDGNIKSIKLTYRMDRPIYLLETQNSTHVFDAQSGEVLEELNQEQVSSLASRHYLKDSQIRTIQKISDIPLEARRAQGDMWRVEFDDTWSTTLYFVPLTGELQTIRSDIWRLFDFVWMLHIMDYDERDDFNNPLLITSAISALLFTITGIILLLQSRWRKKKKAA